LRNAGFTLIEMMITVAIIGILAALAGPMYNRYQAKTRQSEAKINLAHVYSSEKSFYSEYSSYISSFDALQFIPEGFRRYYTVGWNADMSATVSGYSGTYGTSRYDSQNTSSTFGCPPATATPLLPPPLGMDAQAFLAGAAGEVLIGSGCDVWTIDDTKNLLNTQQGL
jgi:type IV pilus assembly protein PilA